ncbi:MAG: NAD(P)/FAD-dependent oxidoreductase [Candidatus Hodgkinia cicadicola]
MRPEAALCQTNWCPLWAIIRAKSMDTSIERLVIIGSGPAGMGALVRASQNPTLRPLVITGPHFGGTFANDALTEEWPGMLPGSVHHEVAASMLNQASRLGARFVHDSVVSIETNESLFRLHLARGKVITALSVIIATGCEAKLLGLAHEQALLGKGISLARSIPQYFRYHNRRVAIIGGTSTAAVEALRLATVARKVLIVCEGRKLACNRMLINRISLANNIEVMFSASVEAFIPTDCAGQPRLRAIEVNLPSGSRSLKLDEVVLASALTARTHMFGRLSKDNGGFIKTKAGGPSTNLKGIFVAGSAGQTLRKDPVGTVASGHTAASAAERFLRT